MSNRLSIVFWVSGMAFQGDTIKKQSLGGSESAALYMARAMAERGHDVIVFSNTDKPGKYDGVNYMPVEAFHGYAMFTSIDVLIVQRAPQVFNTPMKSKLNILWQHDLAIKRARQQFRGSLWNIDEVWGVSQYHINQMEDIYGKAPYWETRNGIDIVQLDKGLKRYKKRLIYTARPERGMATLLFEVMPKIWIQDPDVELRLAGYDNTVEAMKPFYDNLHAKIAEYHAEGRKVEWLGPLTKQQLYKEYQQATLYVYPTNFEEVSCITAMECMMNGLPFIGTSLAALKETVPLNAGVLIEGDAETKEYQNKFVEAVMSLLKQPGLCEAYAQNGRSHADKLTWNALAEDWEKHLLELFEKRTVNKNALAKQFYRNEDIMALWALNIPEWNERVTREYPIIENPVEMHRLYQEYGDRFKKKIENGEFSLAGFPAKYNRVVVAIDHMAQTPPARVLDYGCAIGNEAIQFVNAFGCEVTAVNVSEGELEVAMKLARQHCNAPEKINFIPANHPDQLMGSDYDVVFAGEILEHVKDPVNLIDALEKKCKMGGQMIFTVPLGPWGDTHDTLEQKGHLWSFDRTDLKELFDNKKDFRIRVISGNLNEKNHEMLGWYLVTYTRTAAVTGKIDMERKLAIQAPRQTVSACMIVGGDQEGLLHRCLKSIYHVADEILIGDTGMSHRCIDIVLDKAYKDKVKLIPHLPSPLVSGFDEARNAVIKQATGDWIMWIDSDEELLTPEKLFKYLRHNCFDGYSIRQHHFSAQPPNAFPPDLPVRMFRNHKDIKFFGFVHEHPETALNAGIGESTVLSDVDIAHDGYLTEHVRRKRFERNYRLMIKDREKYPERVLGKFLMMRDQMHVVKYMIEQNKQLTPEIVALCEDVIRTYRTEFLGKPSMMSADGLQFYSDALGLLGRGLEFSVEFDISPEQALLKGHETTARFLDKDDFLKFLSWKVKESAERFEGKYA